MFSPLRASASPSIAVFLALGLITCGDGSERAEPTGIIIQQSDSTPPQAGLLADQGGAAKGSVGSGGEAAQISLISKTEGLSFAASAVDNESGVQTLEVWIEKREDICEIATGLCSGGNFQAEQTPRFSFATPARPSGEETPPSSILIDTLSIADEIPQSPPPAGMTRTVVLRIYVVALNHLGGESQTPNLELTWSEPR